MYISWYIWYKLRWKITENFTSQDCIKNRIGSSVYCFNWKYEVFWIENKNSNIYGWNLFLLNCFQNFKWINNNYFSPRVLRVNSFFAIYQIFYCDLFLDSDPQLGNLWSRRIFSPESSQERVVYKGLVPLTFAIFMY